MLYALVTYILCLCVYMICVVYTLYINRLVKSPENGRFCAVNNVNKTLINRVKRTTIQLHAHVILSVNANPTNWNNEPLAESFNARAQGFF